MNNTSKYAPPIYFKKEPDNEYVIESYQTLSKLNRNNLEITNTTTVLLDCLAEFTKTSASNLKLNKLNVKWFKDNIDLDYSMSDPVDDFKKFVLKSLFNL